MAEKRTVELEIKDNSKSLKAQYKEAVLELQKVAAAYGETSKEAVNAARAAANLKDQIEDTNDLMQSFKGEGAFIAMNKAMTAVASGFSAVEGGMALVGVEGENVQATMLKVQSAMALAQGLEGLEDAGRAFKNLGTTIKSTSVFQLAYNFIQTGSIKESIALTFAKTAETEATVAQGVATATTSAVTTASTKGLRLFRLALIGTGLGLFIVLIGALIANFDKLLNVFSPVIDGLKNIGDAIGLTDFAGDKRAKNEKARSEAELKQLEKLKIAKQNAFNNEQKALDRLIAIRSAEGKSTTELTKQKIAGSIAFQKEQLNEIALGIELLRQYENSLKRAGGAETFDKVITEQETKLEELKNSILDSENELKLIDINAKKDAVDRNKDFSDKQRELARQIEKERIDAMEDGMQKRLDLLKFNEEGELLQIKGKGKKEGELRTAIETRYEKERNKVKEEFRVRRDRDEDVSLEKRPIKRLEIGKSEIDAEAFVQNEILRLEQEAEDKRKANLVSRTDQILKAAQTFTQVYSSLNGLLNASDNERLKKIEKGSAEEQKIKKRMFNRDKALRISQTIVDTASNIVTSVRNGGGIPTGIPFGIAAGAMGALQIAAITKAKYDGGETPADNGGGSGGGGGSTTPQFNTIGSSGVNQLAQLQQQPVQAYVVSGDVTSAQSLDRNRIQNATL